MEPIEKLKREVREWLVSHQPDRDTAFYGPDEWRARNEPYLADAALILVFEGAMFSVMNGHRNDSRELYDEFTRFLRGSGYFFEFGHAWNMGFYPVPTNPFQPETHTTELDGRSAYTVR